MSNAKDKYNRYHQAQIESAFHTGSSYAPRLIEAFVLY
jgi:hypothetical protein